MPGVRGGAVRAVLTNRSVFAVGVLPSAAMLLFYRRLRRIDAQRPAVDRSLVALVRQMPIFAPLAAFRIEQMLVNMREHHFDADELVFDEGDTGDDLFIVTDRAGSVLDSTLKRRLTRNAVLPIGPRTATRRGYDVGAGFGGGGFDNWQFAQWFAIFAGLGLL